MRTSTCIRMKRTIFPLTEKVPLITSSVKNNISRRTVAVHFYSQDVLLLNVWQARTIVHLFHATRSIESSCLINANCDMFLLTGADRFS